MHTANKRLLSNESAFSQRAEENRRSTRDLGSVIGKSGSRLAADDCSDLKRKNQSSLNDAAVYWFGQLKKPEVHFSDADQLDFRLHRPSPEQNAFSSTVLSNHLDVDEFLPVITCEF